MKRLSGYVAFLMAFLPFVPLRVVPPINSFYMEWLALFCAAIFVFVNSLRWTQNSARVFLVGPIAFIFFSMAIWVFLQYEFGLVPYVQDGMIFVGVSLIVAAIAGTMIRVSRIEGEREYLLDAIALGLFASALLNTAQSIVTEHGYLLSGLAFAYVQTPNRWLGFLGQPNHYAALCVLGLFSADYLFSRGVIRRIEIFYLLTSALLFGLAESSSRNAVLFAVLFFGVRIFLRESWRARSNPLILLIVLLSSVAVAEIFRPDHLDALTRTNAVSSRFDMQVQSLQLFWHNLILGVGWGGTAWARILETQGLIRNFSTTNAHNIFVQMAAEFGVLGVVILVSGFLFWVCAVLKLKGKKSSDDLMYGVMVSGYLWWYSLFEYPLWYCNWLIVFAVFYSIVVPFHHEIRVHTLFRLSPLLWFVVLGVVGLSYFDYRRIEGVTMEAIAQSREGGAVNLPFERIEGIAKFTLFQGQADLMHSRLLAPDPLFIDFKDLEVRRVAKYMPTAETIARLILFDACLRRESQAQFLIDRVRSEEHLFDELVNAIDIYQKTYPECFSGVHW